MDTWVNQLHARASLVHSQIAAWISVMGKLDGVSATEREAALRPLYDKLQHLYTEDLPIAQVRDASEIIVHAEGPAAQGTVMQLRAVNWLSAKVKQQLFSLAVAAVPQNADSASIAKKVQWNVTGVAPGSIFMGFAVVRPPSQEGFEESDRLALDTIVSAAQSLSVIPQFMEKGFMDPEVADAVTDPGVRDAAMYAAMRLSPTTASGLVSVEVESSNGDHGLLSQRERIILRDSLRSPLLITNKPGSFEGEVREVDLDLGRFELRNIPGIGTIRCAGLAAELTQSILGHRVKVSGKYETDRNGRPRLMRVERIDRLAPQQSIVH